MKKVMKKIAVVLALALALTTCALVFASCDLATKGAVAKNTIAVKEEG